MTITRYINSIRNPAKANYAAEYWSFLISNRASMPDRLDFGISSMGAQAVRMRINEIHQANG